MHCKKPFHYRSPGNAVKESYLEPLDWTAVLIMGQQRFIALLLAIASILAGCSTVEENPRKNIQLGLITTPPAYYTTQKARYLGEKYKSNLDRIVERIVRNPKTANLQFANNIASVGGIGFFTHSATSSIDERFLEIIVGVPDTFDAKMDRNVKVHQVFSRYGTELLAILVGDADIYQEREVSGYGLNLAWRNLVSDSAGSRISLERTTLYFQKSMVQGFLRGDVSQTAFLGDAIMFAVVDDGPMQLVSYRPQESTVDLRRPIEEEPLSGEKNLLKAEVAPKKVTSLAPATNRPVAKEQGKGSIQSLFQAKEKIAESEAQATRENDDNRSGVTLSAHQAPEVAVSSSASTEASKSREPSSVVQVEEEAIAVKPELADGASGAGQDRNETESPYVPPKVDLASLPTAPAAAPLPEEHNATASSERQPGKQPLLENQQAKAAPPEQSVALPAPKVLQGFVIQLAFEEIRDARRWGEILERQGFSVSLTEAGGGGSVRVRVGNFPGREEAERHLQVLRRQGLKGMILNLPQPYQPGVHPVTEESGNTLSAVR